MNGLELARSLHTSTRTVKHLLDNGTIQATREKGAWNVNQESYQAFVRKNKAAIRKLKAEFYSLYWQGLTVGQLQNRTKSEFEKRGIIFQVQNFAEQTIYEKIMNEKRGCKLTDA